jgi:hypothetical protein
MSFRAYVHVNTVLIRGVCVSPGVQPAIQTKLKAGASTCFTQRLPLGAQAAGTS